MHYTKMGNENAPALICVPGLLGGAQDFMGLVSALESSFCIFLLDPHAERREKGLSNLGNEDLQAVNYSTYSDEIFDILAKYGRDKTHMAGISIGGKVVYDFAIKYPDVFQGALVSDAGPGSFEESDLYTTVLNIVEGVNLNQTWPELKASLAEGVKDRALRSLLLSQIYYVDQKPPAKWRLGIKSLKEMLLNRTINDQFEDFARVDEFLDEHNSRIKVLKASHESGINSESYAKLKKFKSVEMIDIPNSTHFLHISHKEDYQKHALSLLKNINN